ncbi:hypothetical protein [Flavobacterium davisii]|uniref:hypothetical protein n=1 Tax=Flavobacterium davisii TaxID=2906077 RepID=UPI0035D120AE
MHEWTYSKGQEAETSVNELGEVYLSQKEAINDLVTWVYQENSFVPSAKIQGEEQFSIISDYIGRPVQCYSENGSLVWSTDYDIYGGLRDLKGEKSFIRRNRIVFKSRSFKILGRFKFIFLCSR